MVFYHTQGGGGGTFAGRRHLPVGDFCRFFVREGLLQSRWGHIKGPFLLFFEENKEKKSSFGNSALSTTTYAQWVNFKVDFLKMGFFNFFLFKSWKIHPCRFQNCWLHLPLFTFVFVPFWTGCFHPLLVCPFICWLLKKNWLILIHLSRQIHCQESIFSGIGQL